MPRSSSSRVATRGSPRKVGTSYYIDASGGNDANHGRSSAAPWQTIGKINGETFQPGDRVLFKRGETWTGTTLLFPSSGTGGNPIYLGAYGAGARPIIDGNSLVQRCIQLVGLSHLRLEGLETKRATSYGFDIQAACSYITMEDCVASACGDDNISIYESNNCILSNCVSYDAYRAAAGPTISNIEVQDDSYNIWLINCECYGSEEVGINIMSHTAPAVLPWDVYIIDCYVHDNDKQGLTVWNGGVLPSSPKVVIRNCIIEDNGVAGGIYGLYIFNTPPGIDPQNVTVEDCTISGSTSYQIVISGDGHLFQRNLVLSEPHGVNISDATNLRFYNNTIYNGAGAGTPFAVSGTANTGTEIKDNIVYVGIAANADIQVNNGAEGGIDIDYNLYYHVSGNGANRWIWKGTWYNWANWLINSSQDGNSPTPADPLFTDAASEDFTLQAGSPARGVGIELGNGTDVGAYQYS